METIRNMHPLDQEAAILLVEATPTKPPASDYGSAKRTCKTQQVLLEWRNVSVSVKWKRGWLPGKRMPDKRIVTKVSGIAHPGSLLAVMGSSGCGKTTLLNFLTMRSPSPLLLEGSVLVNDRLVSPGQMDAISAYVQQDYLLPGYLTVKEQLNFQALLRMDSSFSTKQRLKRVEEIILELGLTKCQDVLIGVPGRTPGISGGERRRLAFASEVLTDPPLIFCDEPTSGLDAAMAQHVVTLLRKMAANGKTVVCTVHQPSSYQFALFDRIALMEEGEMALLGSAGDALEFFSKLHYPCPLNYNPADHFINVLAGMTSDCEEECTNVAEKICQAFATSEEAKAIFQREPSSYGVVKDLLAKERLDNVGNSQEYKTSKPSKFKASLGTQLQVVMWRSWVSVVRNSNQLVARTAESLILAVFYALIYRDQHLDQMGVYNMTGMQQVILWMISYQCIFSIILTDSNDVGLRLFLCEHRNGMYRTGVYVVCKFVAEVPSTIFFPLLTTIAPFCATGTNDWRGLLIICAVVLLMAANGVSFGFLATSITDSIGKALVVVPFMLCPMVIMSGIFIAMKSAPGFLQWIKHISLYKHALEAVSINQWKDVKHIECNVSNNTCPKNGLAVLDALEYDANNMPVNLTALVLLAVGAQLLCWTALSYRAWRKN